MSLNRVDDLAEVARRRERFLKMAEGQVEEAVGAALRQFLRRILDATRPEALTAAAGPPRPVDLFTLGELNVWWQDAVDEQIVDAVARVWRTGYFATRDGQLESSSLEGAQTFLENVRDRLSRTATPTIPDQAFDTARIALSDEMARGSSIRTMSERLGAEFGWSDDVTFWRDRLSDVDGRIDQILDGIGPPGDQAREAARLQDPTVQALRDQRNEAIGRIDADRSRWQVRAERVARTESTAAWNGGAYQAAVDEGAGVKMWTATNDERTRDEHMEANGQCVPVTSDFQVGGVPLAFPGDPSGPPELVINCRAVLPGTLIAGRVLAAMRREYDGPTCVIRTAEGNELAATPEHPVLTLRGWLRADEVEPGDQCLRYGPGVEIAGRRPDGGPHVGDRAASVEQVYEAAAFAASLGQGRRTDARDFDEQGFGVHVDCVAVDDPLSVGVDPDLAERLAHFGVAASRREVCASSDPVTLMRVTHPNAHRFRSSSRFVSDLDESGHQHRPGYVEVSGDRLHRLAGFMAGDDAVDVDVEPGFPGAQPVRSGSVAQRSGRSKVLVSPAKGPAEVVRDLLDGHAGVVEATEVVEVRAGRFAGHVYDLSTGGGVFMAGGILVHNCTTVYADSCEELGSMRDQAEEIARERAHEEALAEEERREAALAD